MSPNPLQLVCLATRLTLDRPGTEAVAAGGASPAGLVPRQPHLARLIVSVAVLAVSALPLPGRALSFVQSADYLIVGSGAENDVGMTVGVGQAANTNNFELGANKAPVPATSNFLNGGSSGGPQLAGNVPNPPSNARPVPQGVIGGGNIAVTSTGGVFNLQNVGVYGDLGVRCAQSEANCDVGTSNSFFNDPNLFPNTFDTNTQTGTSVNPNDAVQSTRMDQPNGAGVTGGVNFSVLIAELAANADEIPTLLATSVLDTSGNGGKISTDTTITLNPGLNVIDIVTGGNDFLLENSNLVIQGGADSVAIFRVPDRNFLVSNGNILVGNGGIGLNSVLFFSDKDDNNTHFSFNNTILNGVAFWSVGADGPGTTGGGITVSNGQGCTQLVADKVTLSDVRFGRCAAVVPEPSPLPLVAIGLVGLVAIARRQRRMQRRRLA